MSVIQVLAFMTMSILRMTDPAVKQSFSGISKFSIKEKGSTVLPDSDCSQSLLENSVSSDPVLEATEVQNFQNQTNLQIILSSILIALKHKTSHSDEFQHYSRSCDLQTTKEELGYQCETSFETSTKVYYHQEYESLRRSKNIDWNDLKQSLSPSQNQNAIREARQSLANGGSFFLFSEDGNFVLKTMSRHEYESLIHKLGLSYFQHLTQYPASHLCKVYGAFKIKEPMKAVIYCALMENLG